ncbi:MAG: hypothetical protein L0H96_18020 [Humibacillus sp.]|nr:hypothetical protein [Humibacillus sp.]MDN5778796.1 hypothetical protein [Humibacillus sp.]
MFTTLITETGTGGGFPVQGLITVLVIVAIFYPVQKRVRKAASLRRRERWAEAGLLAPEEQRDGDEISPDEPGPDAPSAANPTPSPSPPSDDRPA